MKQFVAIAMFTVLSVTMLAQEGPPEDVYVETLEVTVVSLDVFVVDRKGNPVAGLKPEDFTVLENGRPVEISNFSEVRETPPLLNVPTISPAPMERIPEERSRKVIFFIDNETVHPFNRNRVFDEIRGFAGQMLRPGDQAMLVTWNRGLRIEVPFTSLVSEFQSTLRKVATQGTAQSARVARRRQAEQAVRVELMMARDTQAGISLRDAYENSLSIARAYSEEVRNELHAKTAAIAGLMSTLAGVEGKKAFIYVGEELPMQPGLEMFNYINEQFNQIPMIELRQQGVSMQNPETQAVSESPLFERVSRAANANGVTIYMLNAGGSSNLSDTPAERSEARSLEATFIDSMDRMSAFRAIAERTGGLAFVETSNIAGSFKRIERDFGTYYSIGYHARTDAQFGEKRIRVELAEGNYEVRTRRTFVTKSTADQVVDGVIANLFYDTGQGELPIRVETDAPVRAKGGHYKVTMRVMIPTEALTLIPMGETLAGKFSVFLGVGDGKGGISQVNGQEQPVRVPASDLGRMVGKHFTFETSLLMRKGENVLAVAVLDNISNTRGYSRTHLTVR